MGIPSRDIPAHDPITRIRVYGIPAGQPRPRAFSIAGKARMYDPGTAEAWKSEIAAAFAGHNMRFDGAVRIHIVLLFPRPKRLMTKKSPTGRLPHTQKPDCDNCVKAVLDCLTRLGVWGDDAQVFDCRVKKMFVEVGEKPGAWIQVIKIQEAA